MYFCISESSKDGCLLWPSIRCYYYVKGINSLNELKKTSLCACGPCMRKEGYTEASLNLKLL